MQSRNLPSAWHRRDTPLCPCHQQRQSRGLPIPGQPSRKLERWEATGLRQSCRRQDRLFRFWLCRSPNQPTTTLSDTQLAAFLREAGLWYDPAHESRPGGRVKTHATTVGSRRWRCTMCVDCGRLDPGEWQSHVPERLDEAELADWRAVRDAGLPARSSDDRRRPRCSRRMSGGGGALGAWAWACGGSCCGRPTPALALATVTAVRGLHWEGQAEWASPEDVVRAPTSAVNNPDRCGRTVSKIT